MRIEPEAVAMWLFAGAAFLGAATASIIGLFGLPLPWQATTGGAAVWTEAFTLHGRGLYDLDIPFTAGGAQGADIVTLFIVLPLAALVLARVRAPGAARPLLFAGVMAWLIYVYASQALGTVVYNELFLLYVAIMASAGLAFALALARAGRALPELPAALPTRTLALFLVVSGLVTAVVWLLPLVGAIRAGTPPPYMAHYTARVTDALDIGVILPACLAAGLLLWRRAPAGLLIAVPLLSLEALLLPMIGMQSMRQIQLGLSFTPGELIGPIGGFVLVSGLATLLLLRTIRALAAPGLGPPHRPRAGHRATPASAAPASAIAPPSQADRPGRIEKMNR